MSKVLEQQLAEAGAPQAPHAGKIVRLVNEAINRTRELARGLLPVFSDADGLMSALQQLPPRSRTCSPSPAGSSARARSGSPTSSRATHLYHIAQEAVNNAIKHGGPEHILDRAGS